MIRPPALRNQMGLPVDRVAARCGQASDKNVYTTPESDRYEDASAIAMNSEILASERTEVPWSRPPAARNLVGQKMLPTHTAGLIDAGN